MTRIEEKNMLTNLSRIAKYLEVIANQLTIIAENSAVPVMGACECDDCCELIFDEEDTDGAELSEPSGDAGQGA